MTFEELQLLVVAWADEKGILERSNTQTQLLKTVEELGELVGAVLKDKVDDAKDGFGDVLVTLILAAELYHVELTECLELAYDTIAKRKGKMVDGVFVKDC